MVSENDERCRKVFENTAVGMMCSDLEENFLEMNPKFCNMLGYTREELLTMSVRDITHPDDLKEELDRIKKILEGKTDSYSMEKRFIRKDSFEFWGKVTVSMIKDSSGKPEHFAGVLRNITEYKQTRDALTESHNRFREVTENIKEVFWIFDLKKQRVLYVSPAYEDIWGRSIKALYKDYNEWGKSIHTKDKTFAETSFNKMIETGGGEEREYRIVRPDGSIRWVSDRGFVVYDDDGIAQKIVGVADDITNRKKAEKKLKASEEKYRRFVQDSIDGIAIVEGIEIKFVNKALLRMYGYNSEKEMIGRPITDMISEEYQERMVGRGWEREEGKQKQNRYEFRAIRKDGTVFPAELSVGWIRYKGRKARQGIVRDISEKKKAQEALRKSEERLRDFMENLEDVVYESDTYGNVTYANKISEKITGLSLKDIVGRSFLPLFTKESQKIAVDVYQRTLSGENPEYELTFINGKVFQFKNIPIRDLDDKITGIFGIARDVTKRKKNEDIVRRTNEQLEEKIKERTSALVAANQQLKTEVDVRKKADRRLKKVYKEMSEESYERKKLSKELINLLEKDRHKIAMELHDQIGQTLTSLKLIIENTRNDLDIAVPELKNNLKKAEKKVIQALREIRDVSYGLRPNMLGSLGLLPTLKDLFENIKLQSNINIHFFNQNLPPKLSAEAELAIYRITQEALNNVIKHSRAENAFINLVKKIDLISLSIEDDGVGFNVNGEVASTLKDKGPLGLLIMKERTIQLNGEFSIESLPDKGTHVLVEIPLLL